MIRVARVLGAALLVAACSEVAHAPRAATPAAMVVVAELPAAGLLGATAGSFSVRVVDAAGQPMAGIPVQFSASLGSGDVTPARDTSDADGMASTSLTLSSTPGPNRATALVAGVGPVHSAIVVGQPGETHSITFASRVIWLEPGEADEVAVAVPRDRFGNPVAGDVTWTSRNPALVTATPDGPTSAILQPVSRPGETWIVASHGGATDSVPVAVHDMTSSPCDFLSAPVELPVGATLDFESAGRACVRAPADAEYVLVAHYNSPVASANAGIGVVAHGIAEAQSGANIAATRLLADPATSFEAGLRARERSQLPLHVTGARSWYDARSRMRSLSAVTRVGDIVSVNVNPYEFCTEPTLRNARVAAMTSGTIVLEDASNPSGGFTDQEYHEIAMLVDTLVVPVNTEAFGTYTDIDNNGRIAVLFTRAVNELTPRGSSGIVLGFFYSRDMLPRSGRDTECPGSNAGEIFYLLVPDPTGVSGDVRPKSYVHGVTVSTIAHELQHLINSSRRLYLTRTQDASEEPWLNEGLSHIAEELVFYRASGLSPRQNIGGGALADGTRIREMHDLFMRGNFGRLQQFLVAPQASSPLATNDLLSTRGASWAFLRYVADRVGAVDGDLWRRLVDGRYIGVANLDAAIAGSGITTMGALRDWSVAVAVDDVPGNTNPALNQPSWDFATALPQVGFGSGPEIVPLRNGVSSALPIRSGGSMYFRFSVASGRAALVQVATGGGVAQPGVRLIIVRTR